MRIRSCILFVCGVLLASCQLDKKDIAEDKVFYFEVSSNAPSTTKLIQFLKQNMDNKRVAITNQSGKVWPFYEVLAPEQDLPLDSLMPPHDIVHLLKEKGDHEIKKGEFFVDIQVNSVADTLPNYELVVYRMDSEGLELSAESGIHFIDAHQTTDSLLLYNTLLKSIVRYSFK